MSYYPKTCNFTICSIYRHGGHDGWSSGSSDISFKGNPLRMIQANFGLNWPIGFRDEYFWFKLAYWFQRWIFFKKFTDGRRMPSDGNSSHRWAKKYCSVYERVIRVCCFFSFFFLFYLFCLFVCLFVFLILGNEEWFSLLL